MVINRISSLCASVSHAERSRMDSAALTLGLQCQNDYTAQAAWDQSSQFYFYGFIFLYSPEAKSNPNYPDPTLKVH